MIPFGDLTSTSDTRNQTSYPAPGRLLPGRPLETEILVPLSARRCSRARRASSPGIFRDGPRGRRPMPCLRRFCGARGEITSPNWVAAPNRSSGVGSWPGAPKSPTPSPGPLASEARCARRDRGPVDARGGWPCARTTSATCGRLKAPERQPCCWVLISTPAQRRQVRRPLGDGVARGSAAPHDAESGCPLRSSCSPRRRRGLRFGSTYLGSRAVREPSTSRPDRADATAARCDAIRAGGDPRASMTTSGAAAGCHTASPSNRDRA